MRSLNAQIEYLLRDALKRAGRLPKKASPDEEGTDLDSNSAERPHALV